MKRIKIIGHFGIWPDGIVLTADGGMYREFKNALFGLSQNLVDYAIKTGAAKYL